MRQKQKRKKFLESLGSIFGGIVVVVATVLYFYADKVFDASGEIYKHAIYIVIGGYLVVFFASLIVAMIFKVRFVRHEIYEEVVNNFDKNCKKIGDVTDCISQTNKKLEGISNDLAENIEKERSFITQNEIGRFVLNREKVIDLESSVGNFEGHTKKCKIYIQSSLFVLEKGPLADTILWNLRKGVKYIYSIPNREVNINEYYEMLSDWYSLFSGFLISKDDYRQLQLSLDSESNYRRYWCREYKKLYEDAGKIWGNTKITENDRLVKIEECREECRKIFKSLIETHVNDENEFFITVAAYEIKRNDWAAIIKLPTQNTNKEYYAFKIPNENNTEMNNFMQKFQGIYKLSPYDPNNISTLGGRMELDYSRIFN